MRYFIATITGLTIGLLTNPAPAQVAAMGGIGMGGGRANVGGSVGFGGTANPSVAAGNMNASASVATLGGNANLGAVRSGVGGGYGGTTQASVIGSNLANAGGYPIAAGDARYFGQNNSTIAGTYGTAAAIANQPGQPFALNQQRSMFSGAVTEYNPTVQSRFGGPNNGMGYSGQSYAQGNQRGYYVPGYNMGYGGGPVGTILPGGPASRFSNANMPVAGGAPFNNGSPYYTYGPSPQGAGPGYAPYGAYQNSAPPSYPTTNGLAPNSY